MNAYSMAGNYRLTMILLPYSFLTLKMVTSITDPYCMHEHHNSNQLVFMAEIGKTRSQC